MSLPSEITFIVSPNDKGDNPKRPDYRGEVKIGSATYKLAAWKRVKQGTDRKFVSGKLTLKQPKGEEQRHEEPRREDPPASSRADDEDVPF